MKKYGNYGIFLGPIWKRDKRADFLNTKKVDSQAKVSIKWKNKKER